MIQYTVQLV